MPWSVRPQVVLDKVRGSPALANSAALAAGVRPSTVKLVLRVGVENVTTPVSPSWITHWLPVATPPENTALVGDCPTLKVPSWTKSKPVVVVTGCFCTTAGPLPPSVFGLQAAKTREAVAMRIPNCFRLDAGVIVISER